ncbi:OmpH family outer membrane protein [Ichthyenterobacterium sp. W332]|uniref:OmpH family outer membrane protein n=1 Tax=Microcosmobacter mediterraneus TaxID=3075607 RepID=A0ABU2YM56_9FLAO|nr:OmpH family outer membrane protein [Ichthyenterobacterium sp. W332]MDT0558900.1 OmpH family outer membrane protein [Ichthyenterobacterium sp. W332]
MKHVKSLLLAAILFVSTSAFVQAQSKVAHINTQELIEAMPEMKSARAELEKLAKTYEADLQTMTTEIQTKAKQYDAEASTKTQEENGKRMQEIQEMEQSIRQYNSTAQQDLAKKESELIKPIREKALAAINKVASTLGFDYVLDKSTLIVAQGKDILAEVKKELQI